MKEDILLFYIGYKVSTGINSLQIILNKINGYSKHNKYQH